MSRRARTVGSPLVGIAVGGTLAGAGVGMLVCAGVGALQGRDGMEFLIPGLVSLGVGLILFSLGVNADRSNAMVNPVAGLFAVTAAWLAAALAGTVPFLLAETFSSPIDGFFEAMSGFTTTGATLIGDVEAQSDAILLWRSISQWLGGVGIVVLIVAVAPISGPGLQRAFYAETSGVESDRLTPRIVDTAKIIAGIYLVLSLVAALAYLVAGMNPFEAINHSMTTLATGGFSTRNLSLGAFGTPVQLVAIFFMILGGINFAFYWRVIKGRSVRPQRTEVIAFLALLVLFIAAVAISLRITDEVAGLGQTMLDSGFTVTSIMTSTGFTTVDFDAWNSFARVAILLMMFVGACAGSTAGGLKVIRVLLLGKSATQEIQRQANPTAVRVLRIGSRVYSEEVRRAVLGFFLIYVLIYAVGVVLMAIGGLDPLSAVSAATATLNIIGPGIAEVGALDNYEALSDFNRIVACFLMLTGRLEVFTVVVLLAALASRLREAIPAR